MQLLTIAAMVFAVGGVMFALQNNVPVSVSFLLWNYEGSLAMVLLLALILGGLIIGLVSTPATVAKQWTIRRQKKQLEELERANGEQKVRIAELERRAVTILDEPAQPTIALGLGRIISGDTGQEVIVQEKNSDPR